MVSHKIWNLSHEKKPTIADLTNLEVIHVSLLSPRIGRALRRKGLPEVPVPGAGNTRLPALSKHEDDTDAGRHRDRQRHRLGLPGGVACRSTQQHMSVMPKGIPLVPGYCWAVVRQPFPVTVYDVTDIIGKYLKYSQSLEPGAKCSGVHSPPVIPDLGKEQPRKNETIPNLTLATEI